MTRELDIHCRYAIESADPLARLHERTSRLEMLRDPAKELEDGRIIL